MQVCAKWKEVQGTGFPVRYGQLTDRNDLLSSLNPV